MTDAVILVGGKGVRMGFKKPKPLLKVQGRTVLDRNIEWLKANGINEIILSRNRRPEFSKEPWNSYRQVEWIRDLRGKFKDDLVIMCGDMLYDFNLRDVIAFHKQQKNPVTAVMGPYTIPYGTMVGKDFIEKPTLEVALGVLVVKPQALREQRFTYTVMATNKFSTYRVDKLPIHLTRKEDYYKCRK